MGGACCRWTWSRIFWIAFGSVSDIELASCLSFFLWSSIPDDELLAAAANGELSQPVNLEKQVRRMLADARAYNLVSNFAGQWLHLRNTVDPPGKRLSWVHFHTEQKLRAHEQCAQCALDTCIETPARNTGIVGYNVQTAVDTTHHPSEGANASTGTINSALQQKAAT